MEPSNDSNVKSLRPVGPVVNHDAVKLLELWLSQTKSGQIISVACVGEASGGAWETACSNNLDGRVMAAMLIELAVRHLGFVNRNMVPPPPMKAPG